MIESEKSKKQKREIKKFLNEFLKNEEIEFLYSEANIDYKPYGIKELSLKIVYEEIKEV